jgi:folate-binding protein YgfZ
MLFDRSDAAKIELAGPEALVFLNNLGSADVKNLAEGAGIEAFLTTAKARVVAHGIVLRVHRPEPTLWFVTEPGQAERVLKHLDHYLISEQVELADRTSELALFRLVGASSAMVLSTAFEAPLPELAPWQHVARSLGNIEVIIQRQAALDLVGFDCYCPTAQSSELRQRLVSAGAVPAEPQAHEVLRVEAGWPVFGIDMDENRFVVEVGRTTQAISYSKGCFLGQEPIVMARDRGQVNRMLMGVLCGPGPVLAAGTKLFHGETEVGQTTSSVESPRLGQTIALAYLRRGHQEPGTTLTVDPVLAGRQAVVCSLPFGGATVLQ